jgi:hypothetical protein
MKARPARPVRRAIALKLLTAALAHMGHLAKVTRSALPTLVRAHVNAVSKSLECALAQANPECLGRPLLGLHLALTGLGERIGSCSLLATSSCSAPSCHVSA